MAQVFHRSSNTLARASILATLLLVAGVLWTALEMSRSPYTTYAGVAKAQPVPFSHQHHVAGLGIDCRYCHTSVENSSFAGIPPTKTCMNCHSQIWTNAPMLEPVRDSYRTGKSLVWTRLNDLPDYVYFDHSIHINKGVGCNSCHGPVNKMPLMYAQASLQMEWCLNCHRAPEKFLRPHKVAGRPNEDQIFNMDYQEPSSARPVVLEDGKSFTDQIQLGTYLKNVNHVRSVMDITSCNTCHR
ncbi:MAG TPA: cytochrome c3 family protein [Terriglobales bacterium]|jgi:formamidopyrimidine-DNA glycosylase|nr:cytochrome c3 family protein [Terriglobales bacterium]